MLSFNPIFTRETLFAYGRQHDILDPALLSIMRLLMSDMAYLTTLSTIQRRCTLLYTVQYMAYLTQFSHPTRFFVNSKIFQRNQNHVQNGLDLNLDLKYSRT